MVLMVVTNVGFFYHGFTPKSCDHFYYAAPVLKGTLSLLSAVWALKVERPLSPASDGVTCNPRYSVSFDRPATTRPQTANFRTYNIAQRNVLVGRTVISAYFIAVAVRCRCPSSEGCCSDI